MPVQASPREASDNYAAADFAKQSLEAEIRKADIGLVMANAGSKDLPRPEDIQAPLHSNEVKEIPERSRAARRTPPPSEAERQFRTDFNGSEMMDIATTIGRASEHNAISVRTPPDSDVHKNFTSGVANKPFPASNHTNDIGFTPDWSSDKDIDMNGYLSFCGVNEWTLPLEQGAHGESDGFMGGMNWGAQESLMWSRLNSPMRDIGNTGNEVQSDPSSNWG